MEPWSTHPEFGVGTELIELDLSTLIYHAKIEAICSAFVNS